MSGTYSPNSALSNRTEKLPRPMPFCLAFPVSDVTLHAGSSSPSHPHFFRILSGLHSSTLSTVPTAQDTQDSATGPSLYHETYLLLYPVSQVHPTNPPLFTDITQRSSARWFSCLSPLSFSWPGKPLRTLYGLA